MENYIINSQTLAIIANNNNSTIIENTENFEVNKKSISIIDNSCKYFGSSLAGRYDGSKYLLGSSYKLPIIIDDSRNMIYFSTTSAKSCDCCWLSLDQIEDFFKEDNSTRVLFKNGKNLNINVSFGSFENQYYRAQKLKSKIVKRKEEK